MGPTERQLLSTPVTRTQIELPVATILKVLVTIALLLILGQIWQILLLVFIGLFVAMVLARPVSWLQARGLPRGFAIALVLGVVIGFVVLVLWYVTPGLVTELREFWIHLPEYVETALAWTASRWPDFYEQAVAWAQEQQSGLNAGGFDVRRVLSQGLDLVTGLFNVLLMLIIAVYILADEGRSLEGIYQWMPRTLCQQAAADVPRRDQRRQRVRRRPGDQLDIVRALYADPALSLERALGCGAGPDRGDR